MSAHILSSLNIYNLHFKATHCYRSSVHLPWLICHQNDLQGQLLLLNMATWGNLHPIPYVGSFFFSHSGSVQDSMGLMCMCLDTPACMYKHHLYPHKQASLGYYLDLGMLSSLVWSTLGREGQERGLLWERKWLRVILAGNSRVQVQDTWSCRRNAGCGWACTLDSRKALLQEKGHGQRRPGIHPLSFRMWW